MKRLLERLGDIFASVAFAEAGEHSKAMEILNEPDGPEAKKTEESSASYQPTLLMPETEEE